MEKEERQARVMAIAAGVELPGTTGEIVAQVRDLHVRFAVSSRFVGIFARRAQDNQLLFLDGNGDWAAFKQGNLANPRQNSGFYAVGPRDLRVWNDTQTRLVCPCFSAPPEGCFSAGRPPASCESWIFRTG